MGTGVASTVAMGPLADGSISNLACSIPNYLCTNFDAFIKKCIIKVHNQKVHNRIIRSTIFVVLLVILLVTKILLAVLLVVLLAVLLAILLVILLVVGLS